MALNYTKGTLSQIGEVTTGESRNGRTWARMNILLDVPGYQGAITKIAFQVGTDRIDDVREFSEGDKVEIGWSIYAREYNGRWYNNVELATIKPQETPAAVRNTPAPAPVVKEDETEDLPF